MEFFIGLYIKRCVDIHHMRKIWSLLEAFMKLISAFIDFLRNGSSYNNTQSSPCYSLPLLFKTFSIWWIYDEI
jgi:hypothetical protein